MFYYSAALTTTNKKRPTIYDYKTLYENFPVERDSVWGQDIYHYANVNKYLVPTEFNIILYANLPLGEKELIDELNFDCGFITNGGIDGEEFDRIVETIRCFETRRNLYMMNNHNKGYDVKEYRPASRKDFDITNSSRMNAFDNFGILDESKPNYDVSESFLKEFYGHDYETYAKATYNTPNKVLYSFDLKTNVANHEEWNIKVTNWINKNIWGLANLGFYATNFPDIIFFNSSFSDAKNFPSGTVHKADSANNGIFSSVTKFFKKS